MVEKGPVMLTPRRTAWIGACALVAAVVVGSAVRIHSALSLPGLASNSVEGMLKSDNALLYYVTQRIVESGGLPPDDFRADPRVEHPETSDLPAMLTVGQEFLVAWAFLAFGADTPLHVISVIVMGILASLAAVGVYGLTRELTGSDGWSARSVSTTIRSTFRRASAGGAEPPQPADPGSHAPIVAARRRRGRFPSTGGD